MIVIGLEVICTVGGASISTSPIEGCDASLAAIQNGTFRYISHVPASACGSTGSTTTSASIWVFDQKQVGQMTDGLRYSVESRNSLKLQGLPPAVQNDTEPATDPKFVPLM